MRLIPAARNRLNTVYMTVSFIGTSLGSAIGLFAWDRGAWAGVCLTGALLTLAAFTVYGATYRRDARVLTVPHSREHAPRDPPLHS